MSDWIAAPVLRQNPIRAKNDAILSPLHGKAGTGHRKESAFPREKEYAGHPSSRGAADIRMDEVSLS